ncbi:lipase family protein [Gordonia sp. OPL2]|uniref:lipase family protein n=1 Tax=Gordonia sp. OPL2 TaxID=2486274 RepID=UPI001654E65E|nr:lipase family protein [Gordonia sp. OPL2]ROZ98931.1 triacylglycerol lipase [Gordonia sp. OPL2]
MRRLLVGLSAVLAVLVPATSAVAAPTPPTVTRGATVPRGATIPSPPEFDPAFYAPPRSAYANRQPGEIIAARQITVANAGLIPVNVDAWQVSYRSTDSRGIAIAAVTTLLKPRGSSNRPRPLVSAQLAEDSLGHYCAPSYALQQFSLSTVGGQITVPLEFLIARGFLQQGYAVSIPDHQGPRSAYAAGPLAGRITLDGMRAAKAFSRLGVTDSSPMALYGYSGGAIATGHAAELRRSYAPDLNVVGAAEGGVPADLGVVLNNGNGQLFAGMIMAAIMGLSREYPYFHDFLARHLNPLGQALMVVKQPLCVQYQTQFAPFLNLKGMIDYPGDPMRAPAVRRVVDETRLGRTAPDVPLFVWNSNPDELIPVGQVSTMVSSYCRKGAQVRYTRDHFSEHITAEISGAPRAMLWLRDRIEGRPAAHGCATVDQGSMALDPAAQREFVAVVGDDLAGLFGKALGSPPR